MRLREAVASALHLLVVLSYFAMGCFLAIIPSRPDWRLQGIEWLEGRPEIFYWSAAVLGLVGFLFLLGFFGVGRGRFLRLSMSPHPVAIDAKLLEQAIEECFRANFPKEVRGGDVAVLSKDRLEVAVHIIPEDEDRQMELLQDVEKKLGALLRDRFGYTKSFTLSAHSK